MRVVSKRVAADSGFEDQMRLAQVAMVLARMDNEAVELKEVQQIEETVLSLTEAERRSKEITTDMEELKKIQSRVQKLKMYSIIAQKMRVDYEIFARDTRVLLDSLSPESRRLVLAPPFVVSELPRDVKSGRTEKNFIPLVKHMVDISLPAMENAVAEDSWPPLVAEKQKKKKKKGVKHRPGLLKRSPKFPILMDSVAKLYNSLTKSFLGRLILFYRLTGVRADSSSDVLDGISSYYGIYLLLVGFIFLYFGERLAKPTLSSAGFIASSVSSFFLCAGTLMLNTITSAIVAGICGLLGALIAIKLWKFSIFVIGGLTGASVWVGLRLVIGEVSLELLYGLAAGLILVGGLVALQVELWWIRLCTPVIGGVCFLQGIGNLSEFPFSIIDLVDAKLQCGWDVCYPTYSLLIALPVSGYVYQYLDRRRRRLKKSEKERAIPIQEPIVEPLSG